MDRRRRPTYGSSAPLDRAVWRGIMVRGAVETRSRVAVPAFLRGGVSRRGKHDAEPRDRHGSVIVIVYAKRRSSVCRSEDTFRR